LDNHLLSILHQQGLILGGDDIIYLAILSLVLSGNE